MSPEGILLCSAVVRLGVDTNFECSVQVQVMFTVACRGSLGDATLCTVRRPCDKYNSNFVCSRKLIATTPSAIEREAAADRHFSFL